MLDKQSPQLEALTSNRQAVVKLRLHKFPPLHKRWQQNGMNGADLLDPAAYQQKLREGFSEGLNRGFAQGIEEGKEEGHQEGLRLGREEGIRKGLNEGKETSRQQFLEAAGPFVNMTQQLQQYLDRYEQRRREELLKLVENVTRQVIRCELALKPTQLLSLVEEALTSLPQQPKDVRVLLNPEEYSRISEVEPEKTRHWGLAGDPSLGLGECRIVTDTLEMDVGCQHRLDQCVDALKQNLLPEPPHEQA
ncbi:flagellar assembly protein H [Chania multitudinisentens RB-25]|uniref:Flagellar assembly protein FliH n=1 Tax=Chania multitudinisentens RB-25 TaxID=1441930 RepID=W0L7D8_9GAMM|nr:flagellar assembly protein FliH [Chania multitudinisentens]AHG19661.1 flagellar assembly protein H [Chania multitudinisentens RB-25]